MRRDRDRYRSLVEVTSDWVWEVDATGRYTYASPQCCTLLGFDPEEVVGRTPFDFMPADEAARVAGEFSAIVSEKRPFSGLVNINRRKDGSLVVLETSGVPLIAPTGELLGYRGVDRDITERHKAYVASQNLASELKTLAIHLEEERDRTRKASDEQMRFVAVMTHELRTPLNAIIGFSEEMLEEAFGPLAHDGYRDYLREIRQGGERLLATVNDILDHAQLQVGGLTLSPEPLSLPELLRSIRRFVLPRAVANGVTVDVCVDGDLPNVRCDPRLLRQALLNLVGNAIKFSASGNTVTLAAALSADGVPVLRVEDHGPGMTADQIAVAMSPFGQVHRAGGGMDQGTGLGLPIASKLIALHGAQLTIDSTPGVGTTAIITLPQSSIVAGFHKVSQGA
nr:PAS domain-containing sensor histidine kinase [Azospirillum oryzae]